MTLLLLLLLAPDDRKNVDVVCPLDGNKFVAVEILSTNEWGGVDRDFCRHAYKTRPMEHYVWICPKCAFAGKKKDYEVRLTDDQRTELMKVLPYLSGYPRDREAPLPGHEKYALLALVKSALGAPPEEVGKAYLSAAWCLRQAGAASLEDFDEWERLLTSYSLLKPPLDLGKKNRTDFDLEIAKKVEKDLEAKRHKGLDLLLARYLAALLWRKHGELAPAARWLDTIEKGENSVVDDAANKMRDSIEGEKKFLRLAAPRLQAAFDAGKLEKKAAGEIAYVLGEIFRRLGDKIAADWYAKAIEVTSDEALKKLAAEQKTLVP